MSARIAVLSAGMGQPSATRLLADQLTEAAVRELDGRGETATVDVVELRPLGHALVDNLTSGFATGDLAEAIETVRRADALIAVTPVFTASYSGLFKLFVDVLDKDLLTGKPVLIGATAGTARHSLVLEHALRPMFAYLRAVVVPSAVFAASEDFGSAADGQLGARVARAAGELAGLLAQCPAGDAGGAAPGRAENDNGFSSETMSKRSLDDEFQDPTPFEDLLTRIR